MCTNPHFGHSHSSFMFVSFLYIDALPDVGFTKKRKNLTMWILFFVSTKRGTTIVYWSMFSSMHAGIMRTMESTITENCRCLH